jgi:hypothetical protein
LEGGAGVRAVLAVSAAGCSWGGNSTLKGEVATPESVGETGEGGGGGSFRETEDSLELAFSLTETLFKPCSKNADFVLVPVSFCKKQQQNQTIRQSYIKMSDRNKREVMKLVIRGNKLFLRGGGLAYSKYPYISVRPYFSPTYYERAT